MDSKTPGFCRHCGQPLPPDGKFCESCGNAVDVRKPVDVHQKPVEVVVLPATNIPPRIGRALSKSWDILTRDTMGAVLVGLVFFLAAMVLGMVVPFGNIFAVVILTVGILGWAEERRSGLISGIGAMFKIGLDRISDGLLLGLVYFGMSMVLAIPALILYFMFIATMIMAIPTEGGTNSGGPPPEFIGGMSAVIVLFIMIFILFSLIVGPFINSLLSLTGWAIAKGKTFKESFLWAWERIKFHPAQWWLAGLVINFISGIGVLLCYVGAFLTMPWGYLAWAEIAADTGDDQQPDGLKPIGNP